MIGSWNPESTMLRPDTISARTSGETFQRMSRLTEGCLISCENQLAGVRLPEIRPFIFNSSRRAN